MHRSTVKVARAEALRERLTGVARPVSEPV